MNTVRFRLSYCLVFMMRAPSPRPPRIPPRRTPTRECTRSNPPIGTGTVGGKSGFLSDPLPAAPGKDFDEGACNDFHKLQGRVLVGVSSRPGPGKDIE